MSIAPVIEKLADGSRAVLIPVSRLETVQNELISFAQSTELNGFQKWILEGLYRFDIPDTGFDIRSVILLAVPHPLYTTVRLAFEANTYQCYSLVPSDFQAAERSLNDKFASWKIAEASCLPLKRLSVHSGLTSYGRNNVTYLDGLGSGFSLSAYFTNAPSSDTFWQDVTIHPKCATCRVCFSMCPTGAIRQDTFLVDNEKCLSYMNEAAQPFPGWLARGVHHTLYDCLMCQMQCPMNKPQHNQFGRTIDFSEAEVTTLLDGGIKGALPDSLRRKVRYLGLDKWPDAIPKNMRAILTNPDRRVTQQNGGAANETVGNGT